MRYCCDFEKAFRKVSHGRLLTKLDHYGVRTSTNRWIRSFLGGWKQTSATRRLTVEGSWSTLRCPAGHILGPLLFLSYINDLPDVCKSSDTPLLADGSLLFRIINSQQDGILLQEDLDALGMWERTWQMGFNATKCSVMHILPSNKKRVIQTSYHIHGHNLETEDSSKYLGVTLDNRLNWDQHINKVMKGNRT